MKQIAGAAMIALLGAALLPASTIYYSVTGLGGNAYRYDYVISGKTFAAGEGITFDFASGLYSNLVNPVAPFGWDPLVFQVDDPLPGATGQYDLLALLDAPPLTGISIDFTYHGVVAGPGPQPFAIYRFVQGEFSILESGTTVAASSEIPEPWSGPLAFAGLAALAALRRRR